MPYAPINAPQARLLMPEADNVRTALDWAIQQDRAEPGLRLASAAFPLWMFTGHYAEATTWFERLLALPSAGQAPAARSRAHGHTGQLRLMQGEYAVARTHGLTALEEQQSRGDTFGIALTLEVLGNVALQSGNLSEADALHTESARRKRELGKERIRVSNLLQCGWVAYELGDTERVLRLVAEIEAIAEAEPAPLLLAGALNLRALVAADAGDFAAAARLLEQALVLRRPHDDQQGLVKSLTSLGHVRLDQGQPVAGLDAFLEAVRLARASGERVRLIRALEGCARGLAASEPDAAVRLAGATAAQRQAIGAVAWPSERRCLGGWLAQARRVLGPSAYQRTWQDGQASTLAQAASLAEALTVGLHAAPASARVLTPREEEVAILVARGLTNKQIAAELVVSPATVRSHVEHILDKLDLGARAQVAVWASQQGLLPPDGSR